MIKILVTGSNGQLGKTFKYISEKFPKFDFSFIGLPDFDLRDKNKLNIYFTKNPIEYIINAAAYTKVDKAEEEPEEVNRTNINIVKNLCELSYNHTFRLIHISTDYVFDGTASKPYETDHPINPLGVYGMSKALAEQTILNAEVDAWIIRTSWLFSPFGSNFVKTIFSSLQNKNKIDVVADQTGSPTYALDLAQFLLHAISKKPDFKGKEIYHFTNAGITTWENFARAIKKRTNNTNCIIHPVASKDYPTRAVRPKYTVLSCEKTKKEFNLNPNSWELALKDCLDNLKY